MTHFGFVAIIGRPNVGKSTLMNHLIGQKISITSRKPQTTRNRVMGIDTDGDYQVVYVDTPGLHREEKRAINHLMNRAAESALGDVELILMVIDPAHWTDDDEMAFARVKQSQVPVVLVINKVDTVADKETLGDMIQRYKDPNASSLGEVSDFIENDLVSNYQFLNLYLQFFLLFLLYQEYQSDKQLP